MSSREKRQKRKRDNFVRASTQFAQHPNLLAAPTAAVWERVRELIPPEPDAKRSDEPAQDPETEATGGSKRLTRTLRVLDVLATFAWFFAITKVYVGDIDRLFFSWVAPHATWLLDFRVFAVLGIASLLLLLFKRWKLGVALAYVSFFPFVVVFWKIPKFFVDRGNPALAVGALGVVISLAARAKVWVLALTIALFSAAMILFAHDPVLIGIGIVSMLITLLWWFGVTTVDLFRAPTLLRAHEIVIDTVLRWSIVDRMMTPKRPDRLTLSHWSKEEATAYRDSAGWAILTYRVLFFWAHLVDQFRKGPAVIVLNALILIGLSAQVILAFAFATYGLYSIDPEQFSFATPPDALTFLYYSSSGINEINTLKPEGPWAVAMKMAESAVLVVGLGTIIGSTALAFRSLKADVTAVSAIQRLKAKADEIEALAAAQFEMSLEQLERQLVDASWGLLGVAAWLSSKTPTAWIDSVSEKD